MYLSSHFHISVKERVLYYKRPTGFIRWLISSYVLFKENVERSFDERTVNTSSAMKTQFDMRH